MIGPAARALLPILALPSLAAAQTAPSEAPSRYITVEGSGEVAAVPDMATLSAGVVTRAETAREAMARNAEAMGKVMGALKAAGIADRAIRTSRLSVSPVYDRNTRRGDQRVPVAYQAANVVEAEAGDLGHVGALIDALVGAGANQIHGIRFDIRETKPLEDSARVKAVADARAKAALYAQAAGVKLGPVQRIEERGVRAPVGRFLAAEVARDTAVAPGEQTVTVSLSVRFAIR
jgi:uncharacterized protein YggE